MYSNVAINSNSFPCSKRSPLKYFKPEDIVLLYPPYFKSNAIESTINPMSRFHKFLLYEKVVANGGVPAAT